MVGQVRLGPRWWGGVAASCPFWCLQEQALLTATRAAGYEPAVWQMLDGHRVLLSVAEACVLSGSPLFEEWPV